MGHAGLAKTHLVSGSKFQEKQKRQLPEAILEKGSSQAATALAALLYL